MARYKDVRFFTLSDPKAPRLCPGLAVEIGLNNSLVYLQLEFLIATRGQWLECSADNVSTCDHETGPGAGHFHKWIKTSAKEATETEFPFWGRTTIQRIFESLLQSNLLIEGDYNRLKGDSTKWLAINFAGARKLKSIRLADILEPDETQPESGRLNTVNPAHIETPQPESGRLNTVNPAQDGSPYKEKESTTEREELLYIIAPAREAEPEPPRKTSAIDLDPYILRRDRALRLAFLEACGFKGRESLAEGQTLGQIKLAMKAIIEQYPQDPIEMICAKVIGFSFWWQSGVWWRGPEQKRFDAPTPSTIQRNWIRFEKYCIDYLDCGLPDSIEMCLKHRPR